MKNMWVLLFSVGIAAGIYSTIDHLILGEQLFAGVMALVTAININWLIREHIR